MSPRIFRVFLMVLRGDVSSANLLHLSESTGLCVKFNASSNMVTGEKPPDKSPPVKS